MGEKGRREGREGKGEAGRKLVRKKEGRERVGERKGGRRLQLQKEEKLAGFWGADWWGTQQAQEKQLGLL